MWFKSVYLKTLRDFRVAILGWGVGMGVLMYLQLSAFSSVVKTPEAKAAFQNFAESFAWNAEPIAVTTPGGYLTFKYGITILILALWPILVCSRMLRGEEQRGGLDVLLSVPQARARVALAKLAAVWTALLGIALIIGLLTYLAGKGVAAGSITPGGALLFGLNLSLIAAVFGAFALLISQFTYESGRASGITGGLLLVAIVLDMVHRVIPNTEAISRISPVYYYNLSKSVVPGYGANPGALLVLLALAALCSGVGIWLFTRRDIGGVAAPGWLRLPQASARAPRAIPANAWSLRSVYTRGLGMLFVPMLWWTLGIAGFAAWMVVVVKQTEKNLTSLYSGSPFLKDFLTKLGGGDVGVNTTLLSALFTLLPLLLMAFAITQASQWSSDEEDGRLELVLATPQSRARVILGRFAALATALVFIGVLTLALTAVASNTTGLKLDMGNLAAAALGMIPLGLLIAAIGYLLAGWLRAAVDTGLLSFLLVIWFFISFVGPGVNWPDATLRLSALYYYGTPLIHGLPVGDTIALLVVGAAALALASARFVRKDIGR